MHFLMDLSSCEKKKNIIENDTQAQNIAGNVRTALWRNNRGTDRYRPDWGSSVT